MDVNELKERQRRVWNRMQPLVEKVGRGERLTTEERAEYDREDGILSELSRAIHGGTGYETRNGDMPDTRGARSSGSEDRAEINAWLRGDDGHSGEQYRSFTLADSDEEFRDQKPYGVEIRDMTSTQSVTITGGSAGGYTVPPAFWQNLQIALRAYGGLWNDFKLVRTDAGAPMSWPTNNPTAVYASLLTEDTQISPSSSYTFGLGQLMAWTVVAPLSLVTFQLEEDSAFDTGAFVGARLGEAIGRELASLAWSGTGSSQPLGVTTALAAGSSITQSSSGTVPGTASGSSGGGYISLQAANAVKTFAGSTTELIANTLSPNTLLNMIECIDPAYLPTAKFYLNAQQAWGIRGQVDSNGRPLLNLDDGITQGSVGTVYGIPVVIDNACPNLTASTVGGPLLMSGEHAMVRREVKDVRIMRLAERFADYLAVAYLGWHRADSRSNDLRAAVTVKANST